MSTAPNIVPQKQLNNVPVFGTQRDLFHYRLFAIYEDRLILGGSYFKKITWTEEMCEPSGEDLLKSSLNHYKSMQCSTVERIEEIYTEVASIKIKSHFLVTDSNSSFKITIKANEADPIREALFNTFPDKYFMGEQQTHHIRRLFGVILYTLSFPILIWGLMLCFENFIGPAIFISAGLALIFAGKKLRRPPQQSLPKLSELPQATPPVEKKSKNVESGKAPLYSASLGIAFKIAGIMYAIFVFSPILDPFFAPLFESEVFTHNLPALTIFQLLLWLPCVALIYTGYQLSQKPYELSLTTDKRPPILYLRPFEDDRRTSLHPRGITAFAIGIHYVYLWDAIREVFQGRHTHGFSLDLMVLNHPLRLFRMICNIGTGSTEENLTRHLSCLGPVVAIGRPGEKLATPGAPRIYLDHSDWQQTVTSTLKNSQIIVMQPGLTAGVQWELGKIREHVDPKKVLFCLVRFKDSPAAYTELRKIVLETMQIDFPKVVPYLQNPAFIYFDENWTPHCQELSYRCPLQWPFRAEAIDLNYTLEPFIKQLKSNVSIRTNRPRWVKGLRTTVTRIFAGIIGLGIATAFILMIYGLIGLFIDDTPTKLLKSDTKQFTGKAFPYRFEIPVLFKPSDNPNKSFEYSFTDPDEMMSIQVIASNQKELLDNLAPIRIQVNQDNNITSKQARRITVKGYPWIESKIHMKLNEGVKALELARGANVNGKTIFVIIILYGNTEDLEKYLPVVEQILESFDLRQ